MAAGNITAAFTVGQAAWWDRDGSHVKDRDPTGIDEARRWAGHTYEYVTAPAFERIEVLDPQTFDFHAGDEVCEVPLEVPLSDGAEDETMLVVYRTIPNEKRVIRSDTGRHLLTKNKSFEVVGVQEMYEVVEAVASQNGNVNFRTGGELDWGEQIWIAAELDEPWHAPGDPSLTYPWIAFLNSVDSKGACKCVNTTVRVVCKNTFGAADAEGRATGREFSFRHTSGVHDRIAQAKEALQGLSADTQAWRELAADLAQLPVTGKQRELFVVEFFPRPPEAAISDRVNRNVDRDRDALRQILASPTCEGISDTGYGLVQASAEWLDHIRGARSNATYLRRSVLGPEKHKARAVTLARKVATADLTDRELQEVSA